MWPSQDYFNEFTNSKLSDKTIFRGPYISVWNASQQKEIYGTAWGMTKANKIIPVSSMKMEPGKPYFISPDREGETKKIIKVR